MSAVLDPLSAMEEALAWVKHWQVDAEFSLRPTKGSLQELRDTLIASIQFAKARKLV